MVYQYLQTCLQKLGCDVVASHVSGLLGHPFLLVIDIAAVFCVVPAYRFLASRYPIIKDYAYKAQWLYVALIFVAVIINMLWISYGWFANSKLVEPTCWADAPLTNISKEVDPLNLLDDLVEHEWLSSKDLGLAIDKIADNNQPKDCRMVSVMFGIVSTLKQNGDNRTFVQFVELLQDHGYHKLAKHLCQKCSQCVVDGTGRISERKSIIEDNTGSSHESVQGDGIGQTILSIAVEVWTHAYLVIFVIFVLVAIVEIFLTLHVRSASSQDQTDLLLLTQRAPATTSGNQGSETEKPADMREWSKNVVPSVRTLEANSAQVSLLVNTAELEQLSDDARALTSLKKEADNVDSGVGSQANPVDDASEMPEPPHFDKDHRLEYGDRDSPQTLQI